MALTETHATWRSLGAALEVPAVPGATLGTAFAAAVALRGERTALRQKHLGLWRSIGWREYGERAKAVGLALMAMGFRRGDRACIVGNNCPEWLFADLGIIGVGGISVGVYATDSASQLAQLGNDCGCRIIFVEDEEQLDKVLQVRSRMPTLERIVVFDMKGLSDLADPMVVSLKRFEALGRDRTVSAEDAWQRRVAEIAPDDVALLIYTSGTTGPPKGAMLTHGNIVFQSAILDPVIPIGPGDEQLSFLPLCHIAERLLSVFRPIFTGSIVNFAENQETVPENIREISPTVFFGVPRIWEKIYSAATIAAKDGTRFERWAFDAAIAVGYRMAESRLSATAPPPWLKAAYWLASVTVLLRTRKLIGMERAKYVVTGAAPISPDLIGWYFAIGLDMREAYGMTETAGVVSLPPQDLRKIGCVGKALPGTEVRLFERG